MTTPPSGLVLVNVDVTGLTDGVKDGLPVGLSVIKVEAGGDVVGRVVVDGLVLGDDGTSLVDGSVGLGLCDVVTGGGAVVPGAVVLGAVVPGSSVLLGAGGVVLGAVVLGAVGSSVGVSVVVGGFVVVGGVVVGSGEDVVPLSCRFANWTMFTARTSLARRRASTAETSDSHTPCLKRSGKYLWRSSWSEFGDADSSSDLNDT